MNKNLDMAFYQRQSRNFANKAEYDKTVVIYKRLLTINPKSYQSHYFWAWVQNTQENYRHAELKYREVIVLNPQNYVALRNMGISLLNQGKYDQAISFLKRGLEIRPDHDDLLYNLAVAVTKIGDYEEALKLCERALKVRPSNISLHNWVGYLYFLQGKYKEAILKFDDVIQKEPRYTMPYFNKVIALFCQNDTEEEAKKAFEFRIEVVTGRRPQKRHLLEIPVKNFHNEMNRVEKELERTHLGYEARANLTKIQKSFEFVLDLLKREIEKLS